jgi:hypothetical protein
VAGPGRFAGQHRVEREVVVLTGGEVLGSEQADRQDGAGLPVVRARVQVEVAVVGEVVLGVPHAAVEVAEEGDLVLVGPVDDA